MKPNSELKKFIFPYDSTIQKLAIELINFITELVPEANELIWDNYNAVAMAYSKSEKLKDAFCHIAVYTKHVNLGFNRGVELQRNNLKLEGKGKVIRHITVKNMESFPKNDIQETIAEAVRISEKYNKELINNRELGKSVVLSISEKKIRPNKASS